MLRSIRQSFSTLIRSRYVFNDARRAQLEDSIKASGGTIHTTLSPISWNDSYVQETERNLRKKLRLVDFVVEVRDARIPVSTFHPNLRAWSGKKPRIIVFNKSDLIAHRDRLAWEKHFTEKGIQTLWTAATMTKGGIPNLVRSFFDANFEVNRRRRKTNLLLRKNRAVLSCFVGHPNVGKATLLEKLFGPKPKECKLEDLSERVLPNELEKSLKWYQVEGGVCFLKDALDIPPVVDNSISTLRLAMCGDYDQVAEQFIAHLGDIKGGGQVMDRIHEDIGVHPNSLPPPDYIREVAEVKFNGDVNVAAQHLLDSFRRLDYGPLALEMPYMLQRETQIDERLLYDKEHATGIQNGIFSRF